MTYEFVYVTIHYQCGHSAIRPELIAHVATRVKRSDFRCQHCSELRERRYELVRETEQEPQDIAWPVTPDGQWPPVGREVEVS